MVRIARLLAASATTALLVLGAGATATDAAGNEWLWKDMPALAKGNVPNPNQADHVYLDC